MKNYININNIYMFMSRPLLFLDLAQYKKNEHESHIEANSFSETSSDV